jgi:hypothetical protein
LTTIERLIYAAEATAEQGNPAPCRGRFDDWHHEDPNVRKVVAKLCASCPILALCQDYVASLPTKSERAALEGVWAGVDHTTARIPRCLDCGCPTRDHFADYGLCKRLGIDGCNCDGLVRP